MAISYQMRCRALFLICLCLEGTSMGLVSMKMLSICILGGEVSVRIMQFLLFVPVTLACDAVFFPLMLRFKTLGVDPVAVAYHLVAGVSCIFGGLFATFVIFDNCGSSTLVFLMSGGIVALLAGVAHLIGFCICQNNLDPSERYWPTKTKRQIIPSCFDSCWKSKKPKKAKEGRRGKVEEAWPRKIIFKKESPPPKKKCCPCCRRKKKPNERETPPHSPGPSMKVNKGKDACKEEPLWQCDALKSYLKKKESPPPKKKCCPCCRRKKKTKEVKHVPVKTPTHSPVHAKKSKKEKKHKEEEAQPWPCTSFLKKEECPPPKKKCCPCCRRKKKTKEVRHVPVKTPTHSPVHAKKSKKEKKHKEEEAQPWPCTSFLKKEECPPPKKKCCSCCRRRKKFKPTKIPPHSPRVSPGPSKKLKKGKKDHKEDSSWNLDALSCLKKESPPPKKKCCPCCRRKKKTKEVKHVPVKTPSHSPVHAKKSKKGKKHKEEEAQPWPCTSFLKKEECPPPKKKCCPCCRRKKKTKEVKHVTVKTPTHSPVHAKKSKKGKKHKEEEAQPWPCTSFLKKEECPPPKKKCCPCCRRRKKVKQEHKAEPQWNLDALKSCLKKEECPPPRKKCCPCCRRKKKTRPESARTRTPSPSPSRTKKSKRYAEECHKDPWWKCAYCQCKKQATHQARKLKPKIRKPKPRTHSPSPGPSRKAEADDSCHQQPWWKCEALKKYIIKKPPPLRKKSWWKCAACSCKRKVQTHIPKRTRSRKTSEESWWQHAQCPAAVQNLLHREDPCLTEKEKRKLAKKQKKEQQKAQKRKATPPHSPGPSKRVKKGAAVEEPWWNQCPTAVQNLLRKEDPCLTEKEKKKLAKKRRKEQKKKDKC